MASIFDTPLLELGKEADKIRQRLWGRKAFYVKNLHINFTNVCVNSCKFCAFAHKDGQSGGYLKSVDEIVSDVKTKGEDANELHIVGGLNRDADLAYYIDMLSTLKREFPEKSLKAFGAVEVEFIASEAGISLDSLLIKLTNAGLDMMPGGGAEIFAPRVREIICPEKISGARWLEIMEKAHSNGIKSNATMLYGHFETNEEREDHLLQIRALQEKTGGFNAFIPLAFHPDNTGFKDIIKKTTAVDDLYVTAASRIILDNVPHIKAYWVMLSERIAQLALRFGADDLDGTIVQENITFAAGAKSGRGMTEASLRRLITSAGLEPVERDSFYNQLSAHSSDQVGVSDE